MTDSAGAGSLILSQGKETKKPRIRAYVLRGILIVYGIVIGVTFVLLPYLFIAWGDPYELTLFQKIVMPTIITITFVMGWHIDKKHPYHTIALLFLIMAYSLTLGPITLVVLWLNETFSGPFYAEIDGVAKTVSEISWIPGVFIPLCFMPLYFPTGKLLSRRWRIPVIIFIGSLLWYALAIIFHPWPAPELDIMLARPANVNGIAGSGAFFNQVESILYLCAFPVYLAVPLAIFLRYRRAETIERTQLKWPMTALALLFMHVFIGSMIFPAWSRLDAEYGYPITWAMTILLPVSIGIGILRHRLFDIDIIINRALVYGILTALVILLYAAVVSVLGGLVHTQTSLLSGLVATGIVAIIFQPLHERLQQIVNRVLYGERDDPAAVLFRLAHHLETSDTPTTILPNLLRTIAHTLKIPYVAIWLTSANNTAEVVDAYGNPTEQRDMFSLIYQNRTIGYLVVAPRSANERFTHEERALLTTIAALTATTVRAVQLSDEVRQSRQRIVAAREEERRRIRRDLHDGLGPQLASQTLGLEAVAQLMPTNPQKARSLIESLQAQAQEAILDVRRLVYDLRPPALDDLGLIGALKQSASRYETGKLRFSFEAPAIPADLPAAIETAIFRIAQEAMTNVVRHAQATRCSVRLCCTGTDMIVEIEDDGCGLPDDYRSGIGLLTMNERAAELNGETSIETLSGGGTLVQTRLPLEVHHG